MYNFAKTRNPFECKDIKIALTEIMELQKEVEQLQFTKDQQVNVLNNNQKINWHDPGRSQDLNTEVIKIQESSLEKKSFCIFVFLC